MAAESEVDVIAEYELSLQDLKANSKPHINMLTMLADENQRFASKIVQVVESRVQKADEKVRRQLHKLRCLWSGIFARSKLCQLDIKVNEVDAHWKIVSDVSSKSQENAKPAEKIVTVSANNGFSNSKDGRQGELLRRLQQKKLQLELQKAQEELRVKQKELLEQQTQLHNSLKNNSLKRKTPSPKDALRATSSPQPTDTVASTSTTSDRASPALRAGVATGVAEASSTTGPQPLKKHKIESTSDLPSVSGLKNGRRVSTPAPASTPAPSSSTASATDKALEAVPFNNRIFVDGRGYEVRFIDDVAVIERNGLPHRVSFVGGPKKVVIDGVPHQLEFNEDKHVPIDGQMHTIRFGAPSRELYLDQLALRGSFGGPPIFIHINGVKHKIQLCGPPPEVKIDTEPAHELSKFLRSSHLTQGPVHDYGSSYQATPQHQQQQRPTFSAARQPLLPTVQMTPGSLYPVNAHQTLLPHPQQQHPVVNVDELLAKIAPIIAPLTRKSPTPPALLTGFRFYDNETVQKQIVAPVNLKDCNPASFKTRYSSIIEALYQKTLQCTTCGLRFVGNNVDKYSKHLDWHFKQNTRVVRHAARPWFYASEDWVHFEELGTDVSAKTRSAVFDSDTLKRNESDSAIALSSTHSYIVADNDNQNFCSVCGDKFDQFWDEDEELWKSRNAMLVDGKAYHPLCYSDADNGEIEVVAESVNVENERMWSVLGSESLGATKSVFATNSFVKAEALDDDDYVCASSSTGGLGFEKTIKNEPNDD